MKKILKAFFVIAFWVLSWQGAHLYVGKSILIPAPLEVFEKLISLSQEGFFWLSAGMSLFRIALGFILGAIMGVVLAIITSLSPILKAIFSPMVTVIRATPVASFIILALVWLKSGEIPAFTSLLIVLPAVWANVSKGIGSVDKSLYEMVSAFKMSPLKKLRYLFIPTVRPYFDAATVNGLGMAWKAGIAAEVIVNAKNSIGAAIYDSKIYLDIPSLFAWTLVVIILSLALEYLLSFITKRGENNAGI